MSELVPNFKQLMNPVLKALAENGGSSTNDEIYDKVVEILGLPGEATEEMHGDAGMTELDYQLGWTKTYLKKFGLIENSERGVWAIAGGHSGTAEVDPKEVVRTVNGMSRKKADDSNAEAEPARGASDAAEDVPSPEEMGLAEPWKARLSRTLKGMNAYGFERLCQRLLRECGFTDVKVTKGSGDGGIDGTGKLLINGIFSFYVAFQCKRYNDTVGSPQIRDFRGSLASNIEKGILITTGSFSPEAKKEASAPGKKQIDLMDGDMFMEKLAEYRIGLKEFIRKDYAIDEKFFAEI